MNGPDVVATTADPAFAVDLHGEIIAWNHAAEQHLGYSAREALGSRCWELLCGRDAFTNRYCGEFCPLREMARQGEPIHRTEMFFRTAGAKHLRVNVSALVVPGRLYGDKEIVHLVEVLPDKVAGTAVSGNFVEPVPTPRVNHSGLTNRQIEVLKHLAEGETTQQVAQSLGISTPTVRHHVQQILSRLKVHGRVQAISLAQRLGLI